MKRTFEIEFPDDYGPLWMNVDNLRMVMTTPECIGPKVPLEIRDVTDQEEEARCLREHSPASEVTIEGAVTSHRKG